MADGKASISYHGRDRRDSRIIPLQSYGNPSPDSKFDGLDHFDFLLNKVSHFRRACPALCMGFHFSMPCQRLQPPTIAKFTGYRRESPSESMPSLYVYQCMLISPGKVSSYSTRRSLILPIVISCIICSCTNAIPELSTTTTTYQLACAMIFAEKFNPVPRTSPVVGQWAVTM